MYSQNFDNGKNDMVKNGENLDSNNTTMMLLIQFVINIILMRLSLIFLTNLENVCCIYKRKCLAHIDTNLGEYVLINAYTSPYGVYQCSPLLMEYIRSSKI
jgi:hypothetical protein